MNEKRRYSERKSAPIRHGLYAKGANALRLRTKQVKSLLDRVRAVCPWIEGSDLPTARSWCELEILGAVVFRELYMGGVLGENNEPRRLLTDYARLKRVQLSYEAQLGMTPIARKMLTANGGKLPLDLAAAMAQQTEVEPLEPEVDGDDPK
jgi:hypothetical protein